MKKILICSFLQISMILLAACGPSYEDQRQSAIHDLTTLEEIIGILEDFSSDAEVEMQTVDMDGFFMSDYVIAEGMRDYYGWSSSKPEERIFEYVDSAYSSETPDTTRLYYGQNRKGVPYLIFSKKQFDPEYNLYVTTVASMHASRRKWREVDEDTSSAGSSKYSGIPYSPDIFDQVNKLMFGGKYNYKAYRDYYKLLENYTGVKSFLQ